MAKSFGTSDQIIRGQVGERIYRVQNGKQIVYEAPQWNLTKVRTSAMLTYRNHFAVLASVSRAFKKATEGTFEKLERGSYSTSLFVHYNKDISKVFLTRKEVLSGMRLLEPFCVAHGSLGNNISTYEMDGNLVSNICVGDLTIDETTTVSQLAWAIVQNNTNFDDSFRESILFIRAAQMPASGSIPADIKVTHAKLDLNYAVGNESSPKVFDVVGRDGFSAIPVTDPQGHRSNFLCGPIVANTGACWVHTRIVGYNPDKGGGTVLNTTQHLIMPTNPLLAPYTTEMAKTLCFNSYGGVNRHYSNSPNTPSANSAAHTHSLPNEPQMPEAPKFSLFAIGLPLTGGTVDGSGSYPADMEVKLEAHPALGYVFDQWNDGNTEAIRHIQMPNAPTTYTATFKPSGSDTPSTDNKVTIATAVSPTGAGTVTGAGSYAPGTEVTLTATAANPAEKPFSKWSDGDTQNPRKVTATTNATYTAIFGTPASGGGDGGID